MRQAPTSWDLPGAPRTCPDVRSWSSPTGCVPAARSDEPHAASPPSTRHAAPGPDQLHSASDTTTGACANVAEPTRPAS